MNEKISKHLPALRRLFCTVMPVVLFAAGCASTKTQNADKQITPAVNKPARHLSTQNLSDYDSSVDSYGSLLMRRNLPLAGTKWEWEGELNPEGFAGLNDSSVYRLEFNTNGWFDFQADCKHGAGMYEVTGGRIALAVVKTSLASCRVGSRATDFQSALESVRTFRMADGKLYFDVKHSEKTMIFQLKP